MFEFLWIPWLLYGGFIVYLFLYFGVNGWHSPLFFNTWILKLLAVATIISSVLFFFCNNAQGEPLCMKLNNPMCVTGSASKPWNGQIKLTSGGLVHFKTMDDGLRAGAIVLRRYKEKHKITTLEAIVTRYARGNRETYMKLLERVTGADRRAKIDIVRIMPKLMKGIITMENGKCIFSEQELKKTAFQNHKDEN